MRHGESDNHFPCSMTSRGSQQDGGWELRSSLHRSNGGSMLICPQETPQIHQHWGFAKTVHQQQVCYSIHDSEGNFMNLHYPLNQYFWEDRRGPHNYCTPLRIIGPGTCTIIDVCHAAPKKTHGVAATKNPQAWGPRILNGVKQPCVDRIISPVPPFISGHW